MGSIFIHISFHYLLLYVLQHYADILPFSLITFCCVKLTYDTPSPHLSDMFLRYYDMSSPLVLDTSMLFEAIPVPKSYTHA